MDKFEYRMAYVRAIWIANQLSCLQIFPKRTTISDGSEFQVQNCRYLAIMCNSQKLKVIAPSEARGVGIGRNLMKFAIVTQWVRAEFGSS
ncbi:MAG: hypothetical protein PVI53_17040, partial [Desulfobacteraceae bacterium]